MEFLSKIFGRQQSKVNLAEIESMDLDACPNCWGYQKYDNQFVENNAIFTSGHKPKAFVLLFVEKYITGIR